MHSAASDYGTDRKGVSKLTKAPKRGMPKPSILLIRTFQRRKFRVGDAPTVTGFAGPWTSGRGVPGEACWVLWEE